MKDFKGNELNVGDKVLFTSGDWLREGIITRFTPQKCYIEHHNILTNGTVFKEKYLITYSTIQILKLA